MKILHYAKTDTGIVRKENQDAYGLNSVKDFFVVCDGMGGGAAGDFASKCAVEVILKSFEMLDDSSIESILENKFSDIPTKNLRPIASIMLANKMLHNLTLKYPKLIGMGTTVIACKFESSTGLLHIYHVGDSRLYRIRGGIIELITKDHSKVNELIDEGKMREEDIKTAELQSMITRALGTSASVKVDYKAIVTKPGDHYIMCSDGLNGEIEDSVIQGIVDIHKGNLSAIANELIIAANNSGGRDNTTVIALKVEDDGEPYSTPSTYISSVITASDEETLSAAVEDKILAKFAKNFDISIPKAAKEMSFFTNPFFIAVIFVLIAITSIFIFSKCNNKEKKDFTELTGNISGIYLDVRTPTDERTNLLLSMADKISMLEILKETVNNAEEYTVPLANVQVLMEERDGPNKFAGVTALSPLEIKLPKGEYTISLSYPDYKVLNDSYYLVNSVNVSLELSGELGQKVVIMLPDQVEE